MQKIYGLVKWFDYSENCGYIIGYDDKMYYFLFDNLLFEPDYLKSGLEVKFTLNNYFNIEYASDIEMNLN